MEKNGLIKKIKELSKNAYKQYTREWDDERLDAYKYLDWLDFDLISDKELEEILEEYSRCGENFN